MGRKESNMIMGFKKIMLNLWSKDINKKLKIILDCHYAPSLAWWALACKAEEVLIEQHSFLRKGSYRNRCHVYGANGSLRLSIPIKKGNKNRSTMQSVNISYDHEWQKMHWETLCSSYRSSPFFEYYEAEFQDLYEKETKSLLEFNMQIIHRIHGLISVQVPFNLTNSYQMTYEKDWLDSRELIHPNKDKNETETWFEFSNYMQVFESKLGFIPNLSILDALFNLGPATLDYLENSVKVTLPFHND